jgi:hypothetical protein
MLDIRCHTKTDYAHLPDIDMPNAGTLSNTEQDCLDEIGALLTATAATGRFGVTLLHAHFPVRDGEMLIEQVEQSKQAFTLHPVAADAAAAVDFVATNLMFDDPCGDDSLRMVGLEFVSRDTLGDTSPVAQDDLQLLYKIRNLLERYGCTRRFGISLLHDTLALQENGILLETCEIATRTLRCIAALRADARVKNSIETNWSWLALTDSAQDGLVSSRVCRRQCTKICLTPEGGSHQSGGHEPSGHEVED